MTQKKEKTGIFKSDVIAAVVVIRGVVKNGFHCNSFRAICSFDFNIKLVIRRISISKIVSIQLVIAAQVFFLSLLLSM